MKYLSRKKYSTKILHNFNAGPGALPKAGMKRAQEGLLDYKGTGISVLEMSHRQAEFQELTANMLSKFRQIMAIPDNFRVLMT